jgi:hypothetical protein
MQRDWRRGFVGLDAIASLTVPCALCFGAIGIGAGAWFKARLGVISSGSSAARSPQRCSVLASDAEEDRARLRVTGNLRPLGRKASTRVSRWPRFEP